MNIVEISPFQLLLCLIFILIAGTGSVVFRLNLEKDLAWGTVRTFAQLYLVGYVLKYIFQINNAYLVLVLFIWMIFWAAHAIRSRVQEKEVAFFLPTFVSMVISYTVVSIMVTAVIVQVEPWYTPRYFITLGGMIVGNSMNAITISLERLFSDFRKQRNQIELAFCLGATYQEATGAILRDAIRAGALDRKVPYYTTASAALAIISSVSPVESETRWR